MTETTTPETSRDFQATKAAVLAAHAPDGQRRGLAQLALDSVEHGLAELAKLGHSLHFVAAPDATTAEWPKMVYKDDLPDFIVHDQAEEQQMLNDGWRLTPSAVPRMESTTVGTPQPLPPVIKPPVD